MSARFFGAVVVGVVMGVLGATGIVVVWDVGEGAEETRLDVVDFVLGEDSASDAPVVLAPGT